MEWREKDYTLTDDPARLDLDAVCRLLHSTYWAASRSRDVIDRSLQHSINFSLLHTGGQVGFARIITDRATHGYLCDVVIAPEHRGRGIGKWMLGQILEHPFLRGCRIDLFTRDAQEFYRALGFDTHRYECLVRYPPDYAGGSGATAET